MFRRGDNHPRAIIKKTKINGKGKVVNAKLHLYKAGDNTRDDIILFEPNPNPRNKGTPGAFYKAIKNDDPANMYRNPETDKWKISRDGKRKMRQRVRERDKERKKQERQRKLNQKKKQAYQSGAQKLRLPRLCKVIKSLFHHKNKKRKKKGKEV